MKAYLKSDGGLIIGQRHIARNTPIEALYSSDDLRVMISPMSGTHYYYGPVNELTDESGTPYANRAAFETATKDFFFRVGIDPNDTILAYSKVEIDALIPKFPVIHTTSVSHTGTVTPTVILTKTITIGSVTLNGFVKIEMIVQSNNTPNIKAFDVKLNGTSVLVQQIDASKRSTRMGCVIFCENSLSNQVVGGYGLSWGSSSNDLVETTIDFSAEVTLTVTCTLAVTTDIAYIRGLIIETK